SKANVELQVATLRPAQFCKFLPQSGQVRLLKGIGLDPACQHPDSPHPLALGARYARPTTRRHGRRTAEQGGEFAPSDVKGHVALPWRIALAVNAANLSTLRSRVV